MPIECCRFSYEKYISKNGVVDQDRLNTLISIYNLGEVSKREVLDKVCMCKCHWDAFIVRH
jgi:hypothetical protein